MTESNITLIIVALITSGGLVLVAWLNARVEKRITTRVNAVKDQVTGSNGTTMADNVEHLVHRIDILDSRLIQHITDASIHRCTSET